MTRGRLGAPDARRFSVYRNNVAVGLIGALEARYPASRRIAGDDVFRAIARAFVCAQEAALAGHDRLWRGFPRLRRRDAAGVDALPRRRGAARERLGRGLSRRGRRRRDDRRPCRIEPRSLPGARIAFHPAARLLRFSTPAASIWASAQSGDRPRRADARGSAKTRSSPVPTPRSRCASCRRLATISPRGSGEGATLIEAALALNDPAFDFGTHLVGLVESGAVASLIPGSPS